MIHASRPAYGSDAMTTKLASRRVVFMCLLLGIAVRGFHGPASPAAEPAPANTQVGEAEGARRGPFLLEALVDFPDDALQAGFPLTPQHIDRMMARLAELGIRRVAWGYYGDGRGGYLMPEGFREDYQGGWKHYAGTIRQLGNPLKVAVEAGHRHGLEVYAYFKPYETGPAVLFPEGAPEARRWGRLDHLGGQLAWLDPFVVQNPTLRIARRSDDAPAQPTGAVRSIRLVKCDASPTRMTKEHLQVWTSPDNYRYQQKPVSFECSETVEKSAREIRDHQGRVVTRQGAPVRVLLLSGLELLDKYILVTTDFRDGPGDFTNSGTAILAAFGEQGREIPATFATGGAIWALPLVDFRKGGLIFDYGWGAAPVTLDAPNGSGRSGFIAFTRGRNAFLPAALCETEPQVQGFWLACLEEMIAAGVDGVDFREENHSTHTDWPEDYGFNPSVLARCQGRPGTLLENVAEVRGEAYTEFLRKCKKRLEAAGKRMRYHLQVDFFRASPPPARRLAYPANLRFDWPRWLDERLMDEAVLRVFSYPLTAVWDDAIAQQMVERCRKRNIPVTVNRYVGHGGAGLAAEVDRVYRDSRLSGFIFYETCDYLKFSPSGECSLASPFVAQAAARVSKLAGPPKGQ
jgi:hypothetical protein